MATSKFPTVKLKPEDIDKILLNGPMKGFNRLAIQFYRKGDKFTLVAQILDERRKKMDNSPVLFLDEDDASPGSYETSNDVIFLQHELTKSDIIRLSDNGKKPIVLRPKKIQVNPEGVTYDSNGEELNPCPPNQPGG